MRPPLVASRHKPRVPQRVTAVAVCALAANLVAGCAPSGTPDIEVVRTPQAAEPVAGSSQIVLELHNGGDGDDVLVSVATDAALGVEMHLTSIEDGRASMAEQQQVPVPAGNTVAFRPGGLHLMMVVPDDTIVLGAQFPVTLHFERSDPLVVDVEVVDLLDLAESTFTDPGAGTA